ncbi:hypothetical protein SAMN05192529_12611 [Arachidicoccus rhizosphaerae]|jgi:hypothetical protein|uniref:Uncharacterized protein n=1 Tax=Arachidicoccus rhizosphaerae TaxID=551991 RepID=A0A1H4C038_9BACT|nr:hypothetical protein [Arachidicoccus rhizosphaerae]SEA53680.1 hypothetical protein SAMN05192529_12611 [Arachidicoccus rhizosphaerae]
MIQSKDFLMRLLKDLAALLNKAIGSFPDNNLGITQADIDLQIYTATGLSKEDFLTLDDAGLEQAINQYDAQGSLLLIDFLANLFYYQYQQTGQKDLLTKAQTFYQRYQQQSSTFSMVYFQRIQQL